MLTVPQARTTSVTARAAAGLPVTSKATSTPSPPVPPWVNPVTAVSGATVVGAGRDRGHARGRHGPVLPHAARQVHAEDLEAVAEVGRAHAAGAARAAEPERGAGGAGAPPAAPPPRRP